MSAEYYEIDAAGYSRQLTRDKSFNYRISVIAAQTDGYAAPVKPVVDYIDYSYQAVSESGASTPYLAKVLTEGEDHSYTIASAAPLNATAIITINIGHITASGERVNDIAEITAPVTVASRYDTQRTGWGATQGPVYSDPSNGSRNVWSEQYVTSSNYKTVYHYFRYSTGQYASGGSDMKIYKTTYCKNK